MRCRFWFSIIVLVVLLFVEGCVTPGVKSPVTSSTDAKATVKPPSSSAVVDIAGAYPKMFLQATVCAGCHDNIKGSAGKNFSFIRMWSPSMHANAAIDPYFQATVRAEVEQHPELNEVIQSTCVTCHLPMARSTAQAVKEPVMILDDGFMNANHPLNGLGLNGVACSLCHQVQAHGLGTAESFNGNYTVDMTSPSGTRPLFGPFVVDQATTIIKKAVIGSVVTPADHLSKAELCAVCHTLHTPSVDEKGKLQDKPFPEQTPYLEWQNSSYANKVTCQDCHMPQVEGGATLANMSNMSVRKPVFQHTFTGGNSYMVSLLEANRKALGVTAASEDMQTAVQTGQDFLRNHTASLIAEGALNDGALKLTVQVNSQAGHKLPSGYPSRRVWLHVTVSDASGKVLFESGQYGPEGKITQNDNDLDRTNYEPHYDLINDPAQVQIYEAIMGNTSGEVTTELLRANRYLKDNRLLPAGFDKEKAIEDISVQGEAREDATFIAGGDTLTYQVDLKGASGPLNVTVELLYQPIGFRWVENVGDEKTVEGEAFLAYVKASPPLPALVAEAKLEIKQP